MEAGVKVNPFGGLSNKRKVLNGIPAVRVYEYLNEP